MYEKKNDRDFSCGSNDCILSGKRYDSEGGGDGAGYLVDVVF